MKSCCPSGYTYNVSTGMCIGPTGGLTADPVDCPCCSEGGTYVDQDGYFIQPDPTSPSYGQRVQILNPAPWTGITGECVNIFNKGWAVPNGLEPTDCPCCPPGTIYYNMGVGLCAPPGTTVFANSNTYPTIPCIPCVCEEPPEPIPCVGCQQESGQHINFTYNPFIKQCEDCNPSNFEPPADPKLNCFMPYFLILPNTNNFTTE